MMKYDSDDHYKFHSIKVNDQECGRMIIYFKRIPVGEQVSSDDNLYQQLNNFIKFPGTSNANENIGKTSQKMDVGDVPKNRTLVIMNFDKMFDRKQIDKVFKLCGMLRRVFVGQMKFVDENKKKKIIYVGLVIFKNEFDLTKCFNIDYFQNKINLKFQDKNQLAEDNYYQHLIKNYEQDDLIKNQMYQEATRDGFQITTDKFGNFGVETEQRLAKGKIGRNKNKKKVQIDDDEVFDVVQGMNDKLPRQYKKDIMNKQKKQLQQAFQEDKQKLKKIRVEQQQIVDDQ